MLDNSHSFLKYVKAWLKHNLHKIQEAVISRQDLVRPIKSDNIRHVTIINFLQKQLKMGRRDDIQSLSNLLFSEFC